MYIGPGHTKEWFFGTIHSHHKGSAAKGQALANAGTGAAEAGSLYDLGLGPESEATGYYENELLNPTGFGQPAMNLMTTQAGQAASGTASNADEAAKLRAARTGNTAGQSAIIDAASRNAATGNANAQTDVQIQNAEQKLKQQGQAAQGLTNIGGTDLEDSLRALGMSNEAISAWSGANTSAWQPFENIFGDYMKAAGGAMGAGGAGG